MRILRRLRGLLGLSLAWSAAWIVLGLVVYFVVEGGISARPIRWGHVPNLATRLAIIGALGGFSFGLLITVLEHRRSFGSLTFRRMALWGALAGCAFPLILVSTSAITAGGEEALVFGIFGSVGMLTSVVTLALARRAPAIGDGASNERLSAGSE